MVNYKLEEVSENKIRVWLCQHDNSFFDIRIVEKTTQRLSVEVSNVTDLDDAETSEVPANEVTYESQNVNWWALVRYILRKLRKPQPIN